MIIWTDGNLLDDIHRLPVIPVNCVGVTGAGLAKAWADRYPDLANDYRALCREGMLRPGEPVLIVRADSAALLFPTKDDWRKPSRMEWIAGGLVELRYGFAARSVVHYAVPKLGCGLGGLDWPDVREAMIDLLQDAPGVFYVYGEPA